MQLETAQVTFFEFCRDSQASSAIPRQKLKFAHCIYSSTESHVEKHPVLQFMLVIASVKEKPQQ